VRRATEPLIFSLRSLGVFRALLGTDVDVTLRAVRRERSPVPLPDGIAVELGADETGDGSALLEVEGALAVAWTALALKRSVPKLGASVLNDDDAVALAGGVAAIVIAAARRVVAASRNVTGIPPSVRGAGVSRALLPRWASRVGDVDTATFAVTVDGNAFRARAFLPSEGRPWSAYEPASEFDRDKLASLGTLPVELPIVAATYSATLVEIGALEVGDAWMLGAARWARTLQGEVVLAAPEAERGARALLVEGGVLVLRAGREELRISPMPQEGTNDALVEAVGDVPIEVRVEVGAARMTAREWAEIGVGDIIDLSHKLAEPVTLRVGGVAVAQGELVEIEGEIGVRILSRQGSVRAG
jgi:flagellar motor switch/type III secretory pathway protein FliN